MTESNKLIYCQVITFSVRVSLGKLHYCGERYGQLVKLPGDKDTILAELEKGALGEMASSGVVQEVHQSCKDNCIWQLFRRSSEKTSFELAEYGARYDA